ncbi:MFS transporter [Actinosynnema sp. NPDC051121]
MEAGYAKRWFALPVIMSAFFMYAFDAQVVNVALPSLERNLHAGHAELELVVGGYVFVYAAALVTGGRLGDMVGHRRMFLLGMAGFTVASALCGLAQTAGQLVGSRLLQGLTAAAMVPQMLALVTVIFPAPERPRALAWYGVTAGLAGVFGQILGGLLLVVDVLGLGWRTIFLLNIPVGVVVLAFALKLLPRTAPARKARLDLVGVLGVSAALGLALVPLVFGRGLGWPLWIWLFLVVAAPVLWLTLRWERGLAASGGQPLLDLTLFRSRVFNLGMGMNAAFMLFFMSTSFVLALFLQSGLGLSPLQAGLCFVPLAVFATITSLVGRGLIAKFGLRVMTVGAAITSSSVLVIALALDLGGGGVPIWSLALATSLMGLGNGLILPSLVGVPLSAIEPAQAGAASGMLSTFQQFASVTGIAVIGTLFLAQLDGGTGAAAYARAAEVSSWVTVGIVVVMTIMVHLVTRAAARAKAEAARVPATVSDDA